MAYSRTSKVCVHFEVWTINTKDRLWQTNSGPKKSSESVSEVTSGCKNKQRAVRPDQISAYDSAGEIVQFCVVEDS